MWVTGAYDPELNLLYYGIGNPGPDYHSDSRKGDNLYSDSIVALDADTGKLRWHYQFTPHDLHDWDATEVPVLADLTIAGQPRKVVMFANRNGFYYTLDRTNGKLIVAKPFVVTTWAKEIGPDGRPVLLPGHVPDEKGSITCPDVTGATNFWPPSYDPSQRLFFVNAREVCATYYAWKQEYVPGERYTGGAGQRARGPDMRAYGALRAIDPTTGRAALGVRVHLAVDVGPAVDGVRRDFQRRRRGELPRDRRAQRKVPVAVSDGFGAARDVGHHLHARRPPARAGAGGNDADGLGAAGRPARASHLRIDKSTN